MNTIIELTHAIEVNGISTQQLSCRRPKVRDMLAVEKMAKNDAEKEIQLFANLCEVTPDALMELDMSDYAKLQQVYQGFLSSSQATPAAQ